MVKDSESKVKPIEFGSEQHESLLATGYGMTKEEAQTIVEERDKNPLSHPYDVYQKAKAMLIALTQKPAVIDKQKGWRRITDDIVQR